VHWRELILLTPLAGCVFDPNGIDHSSLPPDGAVLADSPSPDARPGPRRRKLTILAAGVGIDLNDFPILVTLDATRIDYSVTQPRAQDLRFFDEDGTTPLDYEIEAWDPMNLSYVWVRVPTVHAMSSAHYIWMQYDDPTATDAQNPHGVWKNSYELVYHMGAGAGILDSTKNHRDATDHGSTVVAAAKIAGGRAFDATAQAYLDTGYHTDLHTFTIEAWASGDHAPTTANGPNAVLAREKNFELTWDHFDPAHAGAATTSVGGNWLAATFGALTANQWTWLAATWDGATLRAFANGQQTGIDTSEMGNPDGESATAKIARDAVSSDVTSFFAGKVDEVRISSYPHSPIWIATQYRAMTDALLVYGAEE
jgi:hypothetical protein